MKAILMGIVVGVAVAAASAAHAAPAIGNSSLPIEITADSLDVLQDKQAAVFSGKVEAVQGNVTLRSDRMTVFYRQGGGEGQNQIARIQVNGNVHLSTPEESVTGDTGVYDVDSERIQMNGNVELSRGGNIVQGNALEYNVKTGQSRIISGASATADGAPAKPGRVKALFVPEKKN